MAENSTQQVENTVRARALMLSRHIAQQKVEGDRKGDMAARDWRDGDRAAMAAPPGYTAGKKLKDGEAVQCRPGDVIAGACDPTLTAQSNLRLRQLTDPGYESYEAPPTPEQEIVGQDFDKFVQGISARNKPHITKPKENPPPDRMAETGEMTPELRAQRQPAGRTCSWAYTADPHKNYTGRECTAVFGENAGTKAALEKTQGQIAHEQSQKGPGFDPACRPGDVITGTCPRDVAARESEKKLKYLEKVL